MPLAPPEEGVWPTWAECERAIQSHAAREGYAIVAHAKTKSKRTGQWARYLVRCAKSGTFTSKATVGTKRTTTKKTDCPFTATVNIRDDGCYFRVSIPAHNHAPSASPGEHVQHRKMTDDQRRLVEQGAIARKPVKTVFEDLLRAYPDTYVKFEDVSNYVQAWKRRARDNATGVQALLYRLQDREDVHSFPLVRGGQLEGMFWVPRWSEDLWQRTPDVLLMETAQVAHRPVLPVLEMNSVMAVHAALGAGYAILPDKTDPTLLWLMRAVDKLRHKIRAPKPAFVTVTDFQSAEKNVLAEVYKFGASHREARIVFGRVLEPGADGDHGGGDDDEDAEADDADVDTDPNQSQDPGPGPGPGPVPGPAPLHGDGHAPGPGHAMGHEAEASGSHSMLNGDSMMMHLAQ